jgi:hypothetical protein
VEDNAAVYEKILTSSSKKMAFVPGLKGHPGFQNHVPVPVPVLPKNARARARALFGWFSKSRARARALFGRFSKSRARARALFARKCPCLRALGPWPVPFFQKFTKCSVTRSNFVQNARYAPLFNF